MESVWFWLLAFSLTAYVVLDGYDLGAGILHLWAARTEDERRTVIRSIGPVWDGNEVWLLASGGTIFFAFPFPYIATTAGWMTAELGRQPWLVYGLLLTRDGASPSVSSGTALFTLIGFTGLYFVLGLLFLFLVGREIAHGPGLSGARHG